MKKIYLIILCFLPFLSIAQSHYKSGYVVNLKGDTLRGYIDYKEWGRNPKSITFKTSLNDKSQQFGLQDINYFELVGYVSYHSSKINISLNPVDLSSPPDISDTSSTADSVFLKVLQKGKNVTFYAYADGMKERLYIQDKDLDAPVELKYGIYQDPTSNTGTVTKNTFHNQLIQMVVKYNLGSDKLYRQIQQLAYKGNEIGSIIAIINGNDGRAAAQKSPGNQPFRLYAGAAFSSTTVKDGSSIGNPSSTSNSPKINVGIDAMINRDVSSFILRLELAYSKDNYTFLSLPDKVLNEAVPTSSISKIKKNQFFLTPQIIYNIYNKEEFKVFVDVGYSFGFSTSSSFVFTELAAGKPVFATTYKYDYFGKNLSTFQFKAGVVISKKFEIYGAYFPKSSLTYSSKYHIDVTSYQMGLNYFIGKVSH